MKQSYSVNQAKKCPIVGFTLFYYILRKITINYPILPGNIRYFYSTGNFTLPIYHQIIN